MKVFSQLHEVTETFPAPIITMGNFDGVHIGHQTLFRLVQERARQISGTSIVLTFDPHPQKALFPEKEFYQINHLEEKLEILRQIGIDVVICVAFTPEFSAQTPETFVREALVNTLQIREMFVGADSRFGKGQQGSTTELERLGRQYGFAVTIVPAVKKNGIVVSSTKIRQLLRAGHVEAAAQLLERPYAIDGWVVSGMQRGAPLLGFPTANIDVLHELIPRHGVYVCHVRCQRHTLPAVVNIGVNPTFEPPRFTIEAHLLDFHGNLYGERISACFLKRLRDEQKFSSPQALAAQIEQDVLNARAYLRAYSSGAAYCFNFF